MFKSLKGKTPESEMFDKHKMILPPKQLLNESPKVKYQENNY